MTSKVNHEVGYTRVFVTYESGTNYYEDYITLENTNGEKLHFNRNKLIRKCRELHLYRLREEARNEIKQNEINKSQNWYEITNGNNDISKRQIRHEITNEKNLLDL